MDQVAREQGELVDTGAATFKKTLCSIPKHPDNVSCGPCVLIEIRRIAEGHINSPRDPCSDAAELLRFRAKWACEIMPNPTPTWNRASRVPKGPHTASATTETGDSDMEMGETRSNAAGKREREQPSNPRMVTKLKRKPAQGG